MKGGIYYKGEFSAEIRSPKEVSIGAVIVTNLTKRGKGTEEDPVRSIEQYWDMKGNLLWERDHYLESKKEKK